MCMFCKCKTTKESTTTYMVNYKSNQIIINNIPCIECAECGEKYFSTEVMKKVEMIISEEPMSVVDYSTLTNKTRLSNQGMCYHD